jgi:hypothetical protein
MDCREIGWDGGLAQDGDKGKALVNAVLKFWVPGSLGIL